MKTLYAGLPGTGKTTRLIEHYLNLKNDNFKTNGYFIVTTSEQAAWLTRLVLTKRNSIFAKNIVTFDQFLEIISEEKPISQITQQYFLKELLKDLPLEYFQPVKEHLSLYEYLAGLINEIKIYNTSDLETNGQKQKELKTILSTYNTHLAQNKLFDKADLYALAIKKLSQKHFDFIIIDGFTSYNDRQKEIISLLSNHTNNFLCSHLNLPNYQETADFYHQLGFEINFLKENKRTKKEDLIFINNYFLSPSVIPNKLPDLKRKNTQGIEPILIASNRLIEIEQIARNILRLKHKNNYNWSDFCLIFRQIGSYQHLLQEIFDYYEIPITIHEGIYLHKNNFICWLVHILKLPLNNYSKEELLVILKSGFYPINKIEVNQLELTALSKAIFEGKENWLKLSKEISPDFFKRLSILFEHLDALGSFTTYQELKSFIENFTSTFAILNNLKNISTTKELTSQIKDISRSYNSLIELLIELSNLQKKPENITELIKNLEHFLTQKITAVKESQGNQVQVYDALVGRQKEYKIVFLPNLTSKTVPLRIQEDLFLKDYERNYLKKSWHKQQEEECLFYLCLTRASEKLFLSYALNEINGSKIEPSLYLKKLIALFPKNTLENISAKQTNILPALNECLTIKELQQSLVYYLYKNYTNEQIIELLNKTKDLLLISELINKNRDISKYADFRNETKKILSELKEFGAKSIETLSQCRFAFLAEYILNISDPKELTLAIPAGEIIHETLNTFYKNKQQIPLEEIFENNSIQNKNKLFFLQNNQLNIELNKIKNKLELFLAKENIDLAKRTYKPADFEISANKDFAGINITARIDRLDKIKNKTLVIDYKTGLLPDIGIAQVEQGIIPQVWLYCLILVSQKNIELSGCEYVQVPNNIRKGIYLETEKEALGKSKSKNILSKEKLEDLTKLTKKFLINYLSEIREGRFYVKQKKCINYCPFENICRMKVPRAGIEPA